MPRNATNKLLHKAQRSKMDEFYTHLCDIERELQYYPDCFRGKIVYCNCDDSRHSNFVRFFRDNFPRLGLKKLIASCYTPIQGGKGEYYEFCGGCDERIKPILLNGNGDFRSDECRDLLKQSDIVVTNPPFSLFRDFIAEVVSHNKQFLVICSINAITYKEVFELIQRDEARLGINMGRGISGFIVPPDYPLVGTEIKMNSDGQHIVATNNCMWLTNLRPAHDKNYIIPSKKYHGNEAYYPHYDNCDAINCNRTRDIPVDYDGLIGVPISYLHKHNPNLFEIIRFRKGDDGKDLKIGGKDTYFRILIRKRS